MFTSLDCWAADFLPLAQSRQAYSLCCACFFFEDWDWHQDEEIDWGFDCLSKCLSSTLAGIHWTKKALLKGITSCLSSPHHPRWRGQCCERELQEGLHPKVVAKVR